MLMIVKVHVEDVTQLYSLVAKYALNNPTKTTASQESKGWQNLIYTGVETHTWKPVIETLGNLLHARGEVKKPSAIQIDEGAMYMFGGNSFLARSKKTAMFGWEPKQKDLISSMKDALAPK